MGQVPADGKCRHNPNPGTCSFFLKLKGRFCKMRVKEGEPYCGEHSILNNETNRMPCPYDRNHTVDKDKLERHLEKCNSRPQQRAKYYSSGINGSRQATAPLPSTADPASWAQILEYTRGGTFLPESYSYSAPYDLCTGKSGRHSLQNALISEIISNGMGSADSTWILELGAGKGGLSLCLAETHVDLRKSCHFVLVDRSNSRRKQDCLLRSLGVSYQRLFIDLRDLDLDLLLPKHLERVVFAGKHLCGEATCLSLRAIAGLKEKRPNMYSIVGETQVLIPFRHVFLAIATCCHQLCSYETFPQNETLHVNENDFDRIRRASSWHVCKNRIPSLSEDIDPVTLGLYCKTFIDSSRLRFLSSHGFCVQYYNYVDVAVSPENRILVACSTSRA